MIINIDISIKIGVETNRRIDIYTKEKMKRKEKKNLK